MASAFNICVCIKYISNNIQYIHIYMQSIQYFMHVNLRIVNKIQYIGNSTIYERLFDKYVWLFDKILATRLNSSAKLYHSGWQILFSYHGD